ncbi:unnamed protein product [Symbiodinium sp. CCMP2456]|nr:unnamed protein product [Symbiodinium sp. CCMP2456]
MHAATARPPGPDLVVPKAVPKAKAASSSAKAAVPLGAPLGLCDLWVVEDSGPWRPWPSGPSGPPARPWLVISAGYAKARSRQARHCRVPAETTEDEEATDAVDDTDGGEVQDGRRSYETCVGSYAWLYDKQGYDWTELAGRKEKGSKTSVALIIGYLGHHFAGLQQPWIASENFVRAVETELELALLKAGSGFCGFGCFRLRSGSERFLEMNAEVGHRGKSCHFHSGPEFPRASLHEHLAREAHLSYGRCMSCLRKAKKLDKNMLLLRPRLCVCA